MSSSQVLRLHGDDNIVVALSRIGEGADIENGTLASQAIMAGHKAATRPIGRLAPMEMPCWWHGRRGSPHRATRR